MARFALTSPERLDWKIQTGHDRKTGAEEFYYTATNSKGKVKYGSGPYKTETAAREAMDNQADRVMRRERKPR